MLEELAFWHKKVLSGFGVDKDSRERIVWEIPERLGEDLTCDLLVSTAELILDG